MDGPPGRAGRTCVSVLLDRRERAQPLVNDVGSDVAVRALDELLDLGQVWVDDHRSNEAAVWIEAAVAGIDIAGHGLGVAAREGRG